MYELQDAGHIAFVSILSVTLFFVEITQCLKPGVDCSLCVDDFQICYRSTNISIIELQLQLCLNKLQQWTADNSFIFSKIKAACIACLSEKKSLFRSIAICV